MPVWFVLGTQSNIMVTGMRSPGWLLAQPSSIPPPNNRNSTKTSRLQLNIPFSLPRTHAGSRIPKLVNFLPLLLPGRRIVPGQGQSLYGGHN